MPVESNILMGMVSVMILLFLWGVYYLRDVNTVWQKMYHAIYQERQPKDAEYIQPTAVLHIEGVVSATATGKNSKEAIANTVSLMEYYKANFKEPITKHDGVN